MRLDRRLGGLLVLVIGLLVAVIVPRALNNTIDGAASRAPLPPPPPAGSCLNAPEPLTEEKYWGTSPFVLPDYQIVDCSEPHDLEIADSWVSDGPFVWPEGDEFPCNDAWTNYLDMQSPAVAEPWQPGFFNANIGPVQAPVSQRLGDLGWFGCAITPYPFVRTSGSVGHLAQLTDRPAAFGSCRFESSSASCVDIHDQEILAYAYGQQPDDPAIVVEDSPLLPAEIVMRERCLLLAQTLLKREDPTFGGLLTVQLEYHQAEHQELWMDLNNDGVVVQTETAIGTYNNATCSMSTSGGARLVDSLVGIGDKPLPVQ